MTTATSPTSEIEEGMEISTAACPLPPRVREAEVQETTEDQPPEEDPPAQSTNPEDPTPPTDEDPPTATPYVLHTRDYVWTTTDDATQSRLKRNLSTNLHFPRYLVLLPSDIIDALAHHGFKAPEVKAVRRLQPGTYCVTFNDLLTKSRFQREFGFTVKGHAPFSRDNQAPPVYVSVRNAPPELPDAAVIARLKCFGEVISFRRCFHRETLIENGFRVARMRLHTQIPSYIRLASESLLIVYQGQTRTCRRCSRAGHEARDCTTYACFNCEEVGHVASNCSEPTRCSICRSIAHKAYACPYAVIDDLATTQPISTILAAAIAKVPIVPSVPTTTAGETTATETANDEEITEAADLHNSNAQNVSSNSSANTVISSAAGSTPANVPVSESLASADSCALVVDLPPLPEEDEDDKSTTSTKRKGPDCSSSDGDDEGEFIAVIRKKTRPVKPPTGKKKKEDKDQPPGKTKSDSGPKVRGRK